MAHRHISWYLLKSARAGARVNRRSESARSMRQTDALAAGMRALSGSIYAIPRLSTPTPHIDAHPQEGQQAPCVSAAVAQPEAPVRHSGCLFSEPGDSFAPKSALSSEGRCTRCISTLAGGSLCP